MTCELYNLIKEGDLRNVVSSAVTEITSSGIGALYDGDLATPAVTFSGISTELGFVVEFGEGYDLCYVDYYTDETDVNNIQITYGTTSGTGNYATVSGVAAGQYRGTVNEYARFVDVRHTLIGAAVSVNQLEVIGTRNETLGFGESKATELDKIELPHATVGTLSASPNVIPLFNDNYFDDVARVAVAPTFTSADNYIHVAVSGTGPYYGIDDYGFKQPGSLLMALSDDPMVSTVALSSQWERSAPAQPHQIVPTGDGIVFEVTGGGSSGSNTLQTTGIISKEFTAQSFTAEIDVRFTSIGSPGSLAYDFMFILTNGFPIRDAGYSSNFQGDGRRGTSAGGVILHPTGINVGASVETFRFGFRWADGTDSENPFYANIENSFSRNGLVGDYVVGSEGPSGEGDVSYTMSEMEDILFEGNSFGDLTDGALWHTFRIVYDHVRHELSGWIDNVFLGSRIFKTGVFREGCRLFVGTHTPNGFRWYLKNFKFYPNKLYRQRNVALAINGGVVSATVSGTSDNVAKMVDESTSTAYVGPEPTALAHVRVDFDEPKDITYYSIRQRSQSTGTSVFGKTYYPDVARVAIVDLGGQQLYAHRYPNSNSYAPRPPTYSGGVVVSSGIEYFDLQFVDYDETSQTNNALVIEELNVWASEWVDAMAPAPESVLEIPWVRGRWRNLKQYGADTLAIKDKVSPEASYWPFPEYLQENVDYGVSSAVNGRQFGVSTDYHHSESLFVGVGDYNQWHSGVQAEPEPFYIWRYFDAESNIGAVYFDANTLRPSNVPDSFKFQYLAPEGDPNNDADWVDIPPVSGTYTNTSTDQDVLYGRYRNYLIANNDGEFYTSYYSLPDDTEGSEIGFSVGGAHSLQGVISETIVPEGGGFAENVALNTGPSNGLSGFIEFDSPVRTRGIKFIVKNPTIESGNESGPGGGSTPGDPRNDFALATLRFFRANGAGTYTSPVFDTGTPLNTERLRATVRTPVGTEAGVYVRSSPTPPESLYDTEFEVWRSLGKQGNPSFSVPTNTSTTDRVVPVGNKLYYLFESKPLVHDIITDLWSQENGNYPASGDANSEDNFDDDGVANMTSPGILPDDRVYGNATLLDNVIYVAAYDTGNARTPRFMKMNLSVTTPIWEVLSEQRPPDTEYAAMVGYNDRIYFFNEAGPSYYFDLELSNWVGLSDDLPVFGGTRRYLTGVAYQDKIYLFGGNATGKTSVTIFDPSAVSFNSGSNAPKEMVRHQAVLVEEERVIYVLPSQSADAAMKYYPDEDRWEFAESMMWSRDARGNWGSGSFYFYHDGYIYRYSGSDDGLSRTLVRKPTWTHGYYPDLRDSVWGSASSLSEFPWKRIDTFGELMPQNRYFQFKVELYSEDRTSTPILEDVRIVIPQSIAVPASGIADIFVRVGVSEDSTFQMLYSGETRGTYSDDYALLYTKSSDGLSWGFPVTASGVDRSSGTNAKSLNAPWVIQNSVTNYEVWYTRTTVADQGVFTSEPEIYYVTTSSLEDLSGSLAQRAINNGDVAQTSDAVQHPCVLKLSGSSYRIWFTGIGSEVSRIFYGESSDGLSWTNLQLVVDAGIDVNLRDANGARFPCVLLEDGLYRMWYTGTDGDGYDRILYCESTDGVTWTPPQLNLDLGSEGLRDERGAAKPRVVYDSGTYYMYYFGLLNGVEQAIRTTSTDGFSWGGFVAALPPGGLEGQLDGVGIEDLFVLVNRNPVIPGEVITTGKLKIHNEGASL